MKNFTQGKEFIPHSGLKGLNWAGSVILSFLLVFLMSTYNLQAQGIAFFNDPAYGGIEDDDSCDDENYTLINTLASLGMPPTTLINSIDDFVTELPGHNVLIIGEQEEGNFAADLDPINTVAIQSFVASGGTVMIFNSISVINDLFGYTIGASCCEITDLDMSSADGTCFSVPSLTDHSATNLLVPTLPAGSICYYKTAGDLASVASIPFGIGEIYFFGWDWFDGGPTCATNDADWNQVLGCAITTSFPNEDCTLACNNNVQVSLDGNCQAIVVADMILEDPTLDCIYSIEVQDLNGNVIPTSPQVTGANIGETLQVRVTSADGNYCWGYIHIEDKLPPVITCLEDITVGCNDWFDLDFSERILEDIDFSNYPIPMGPSGVDIPLDIANPYGEALAVNQVNLTINLTYEGGIILTAQDVNVNLEDPNGNTQFNQTISTTASQLVLDVTGDLVSQQTLDGVVDGTWILTLEDFTDDAIQVDAVRIQLEVILGGPAYDNCTETFYDIVDVDLEDHDCTFDDYSFKKTYTYRAYDAYGNYSQVCELGVYFERRTLDDLVFPPDTIFGCSENAIDSWDDYIENEYPDAHFEEAGVPTIDGKPIFPNEHYCEINVTFEDQLIALCEGQYKILRKWTALDWCQPEELREEFQIVKVGDFDGIIATTCPSEPNEFPAGPYECVGDAMLAPPITEDVCSKVTYEVAYLLADENGDPPVDGVYHPTGVIYEMDEYAVIEDLPLGRTWIRYTVYDACGNIGECFTEVDIYDDTPPYPVCDQFTAVTLTESGWAQIFAESLDDGSHDNCTDLWFGVRRMDWSGSNHFCGNEDDLIETHFFNGERYFAFEQFCCADVGNEDLMVQLLVCDEFDNCNTCMVNVSVQDKLPFEVDCPPDITIDCRDDFTDLNITGYPDEVIDNCGSATPTYTDDINLDNCSVGIIRRRWSAQIGNQTDICTQIITVRNLYPDYDVEGPQDLVEIVGCMDLDTHPDNTGYPTYNDDVCSLMSSTYEDQVFYFADGACFKIVRSWTVIDWCLYDFTNGQSGLWYFNQVIKVNNSVEPEFTDSCDEIIVDAFGENCDEYVDVMVVATDDCTAPVDLVYSYEIDLDSDDTIDDFGNGSDASGIYPVGVHTIYWQVEDMCGNIDLCEQIVRVRDQKNPTPYCLGGITTVVMNDPNDPTITIWASDFDLGSFDNCDGLDVYLSFTSSVADSFMVFDCSDLGFNEVQIWVTDHSGNQDFCSTMIDIQDHSDLCGAGAQENSTVAGKVLSESQDAVENVQVTINSMLDSDSSASNTVSDGTYAFSSMAEGVDYAITAERNDNYLNGVSTLDLVLIQKHVLGVAVLDSPYKVIAADANNSESVSAADLVELRKLILGIYPELPNNNSWRFVDQDFVFTTTTQPWPFEEVITLNNLSSDMMDNNFVGIKIGDVNGNANYNFDDGGIELEERSAPHEFVASNQSFEKGELVELNITTGNNASVHGLQFTMDFENLVFEGYKSGAITMDDSNLALHADHTLTFSWHTVEPVELDANEVLYTLQFRATAKGSFANTVNINSDITYAEMYTAELAAKAIELRFDSEGTEAAALTVFQNEPNPFVSETNIRFELPEDGAVSFKMMDISGKIVFQDVQTFTAGKNVYKVEASKLNTSGMIYYQVSTDSETITRKMLLIE